MTDVSRSEHGAEDEAASAALQSAAPDGAVVSERTIERGGDPRVFALAVQRTAGNRAFLRERRLGVELLSRLSDRSPTAVADPARPIARRAAVPASDRHPHPAADVLADGNHRLRAAVATRRAVSDEPYPGRLQTPGNRQDLHRDDARIAVSRAPSPAPAPPWFPRQPDLPPPLPGPAPAPTPAPAPVPGPQPCATPFTKASTFPALFGLLRAAEAKLAAKGITTLKDQIHALRGIYYGTPWSTDFADQPSTIRSEGFQRFTRPSLDPTTTMPPDVRPMLDCKLFEALKDSQDMIDPSGRQVDFGHLIIGLDARFDAAALTGNIQYPVQKFGVTITTVDLGGTGIEIVTWLGDLGGAAAALSIERVKASGTKASEVFKGSDYGGSINLEGDVAAFVVATGSGPAVTAPTVAPGKGLADMLADYLSPSSTSTSWSTRARTFTKMYGGTVDASGTLTNKSTLVSVFAPKIEAFACNYLSSRVKDGKVSLADAKTAAHHVVGASQEVATAFVDALAASCTTGARIEATSFPSATPAGAQACGQQLNLAKAGGILGM